MANLPALFQNAANLPAFALVNPKEDAFTAALAAGLSTGGINRLSIKGAKWHIIVGGEEIGIRYEPFIEVVFVGANPGVSKAYYAKPYVPGAEPESPDCTSDDGTVPSPDGQAVQSATCASCPQNVWGSKISPSGAKIKACSDSKRVAIVAASDIDGHVLQLSVPGASLKDLAAYTKMLASRNVSAMAVVTKISFDPTVEYPKLQFEPVRYLTENEFHAVTSRSQSQDVKDVLFYATVQNSSTAAPAIAGTPPQAAIQAPPATPAPTAAPAPAPVTPAPTRAPRPRPVPPAPAPTVAPTPVPTPAPEPVAEYADEGDDPLAGALDGWDD